MNCRHIQLKLSDFTAVMLPNWWEILSLPAREMGSGQDLNQHVTV